MITFLALLALLALLACPVLLFTRRRKAILWIAPAALLCIILTGNHTTAQNAHEAGLSVEDYRQRVAAQTQASALRAAEAREQRAREAAYAAANAEAFCRTDLVCWGDRHIGRASAACSPQIEAQARLDYRWTATLTRLSGARWRNRDAGIIAYDGDAIELQNGFGAWVRHAYQCDYNTATGAVERVYVRPGRV